MSFFFFLGCTKSGPHRAEVDLKKEHYSRRTAPSSGPALDSHATWFFFFFSPFRFHKSQWFFLFSFGMLCAYGFHLRSGTF